MFTVFTVFPCDSNRNQEQNNAKSNHHIIDDPILLNQKIYHLNKSKSKHVVIGLSPKFDFKPVVRISGNKNRQYVTFDTNEWESFLNNQGIITNFFTVQDERWLPLIGKKSTVEFTMYNQVKVIKIHTENNFEILLAFETLCCLWDLLPLIKYRIDMLKKQQFLVYYKSVVKNPISEILNPTSISNITYSNCDDENVHTMMEMMHYFPDQIIADCENKNQQ